MIKKITIYLLCYLMVLINTGCNNQNNNEEKQISSLCNQIEKDIESYQNNEIERDSFYSKLENYQSVCINSTDNICITLNAIISIPKEQEEVRKLFIKDLLNHCNNKK